jgi:hypothetical protein
MLKDKSKKKNIQLTNDKKHDLTLLTCKTRNPDYETMITPLKKIKK